MHKETKLPNANLEEARKLKVEKYKLWFDATSDIYKAFISVLFTALIFIMVFYLNNFRELYFYSEVALSDALYSLIFLFLFISALYIIICAALISFIEKLISEIKRINSEKRGAKWILEIIA